MAGAGDFGAKSSSIINYTIRIFPKHVENIKVSLDTQVNFMFSTCSPGFCCLSTRGPDVSSHIHNNHIQV